MPLDTNETNFPGRIRILSVVGLIEPGLYAVEVADEPRIRRFSTTSRHIDEIIRSLEIGHIVVVDSVVLGSLSATDMEPVSRQRMEEQMREFRTWIASPTPSNETARGTRRNNNTNTCRFCNDTITENQNRCCDDCFEEISGNCRACANRVDVNNAHIEEDNEGNTVLLCNDCARNAAFCYNCNDFLFSLTPNLDTTPYICEFCNRYICQTGDCRSTHSCGAGRYMFRGYNKTPIKGKTELATMIKSSRLVGVELEVVDGNPSKLNNLDNRIGISGDGSLTGRNPLELQTPPADSSELERLIDNATASLKNCDYKVNSSCGMHIHIDCSDFRKNGEKIKKLIHTYYAVEPVLLRMLPKSRRHNKYALPLSNWLSDMNIHSLKDNKRVSLAKIEQLWYKSDNDHDIRASKRQKYDSSRYHGINLHALLSHGHIEVRYHHGTLNQKKIKNWINLHLNIVEWATNNYSKEKVENILKDKTLKGKSRKMVKYFGLDKGTSRYIRKQIRKFSTQTEDKE